MLSDETCCGWRVCTKCKFFYRRICLACVSAHQLDQRLYSSGDCGGAGLCSIIIWYSLIGQAPAYRTDLCRPSLSVRSTRRLRSAEQGLLHVAFARKAGPSPWSALWYGMVSHWLSGHFLEYSFPDSLSLTHLIPFLPTPLLNYTRLNA